ncbi:hypothetical protein DFH06DRAFT_998481, partial [Mycena polygramma]
VHDGVTVRHVCCSVHDCQQALPTQRDHFCETHSYLMKQCCIQGCVEPAHPGFRTCTIDSHRAFQIAADEKNAAMFQMRSRLSRAAIPDVPLAGAAIPDASLAGSSTSQPNVPSTSAPSTSEPAAPRVKGKLTRSWTHNEQLFVRCCGIIISRATFFGSEGISGVKVVFSSCVKHSRCLMNRW